MKAAGWKAEFNEEAKKMSFEEAVYNAHYMLNPRITGELGRLGLQRAVVLVDNLYDRLAAITKQEPPLYVEPLAEQIRYDRGRYWDKLAPFLRVQTEQNLANAKTDAQKFLQVLMDNEKMPPAGKQKVLQIALDAVYMAAVYQDRLDRWPEPTTLSPKQGARP